MAKYETKDIRNIAFLGHGDSGKTSLADYLVFKNGGSTRLGKIEDGTSVFDFEAEEKDRKISIDAAEGHFGYKGKEINLIDCPGYPDFIGEAISALMAVDTAAICINAAAGIQVNTVNMWKAAAAAGVARCFLVNKCDAENINLPELLESIRTRFGEKCLPLTLPLGVGPGMKGVVNVLDAGPNLPPDAADLAGPAREKLVESIVEVEDALMERYLDGKEIGKQEIDAAFVKAISLGRVFPILFTSMHKEMGVAEFLEFVAKDLPGPGAAGSKKGKAPETDAVVGFEPRPETPFSAQVWRINNLPPQVNRLSYIRVHSGTLAADTQVYNVRAKATERIGKVFKIEGKEQQAVDKLCAGDIGAVAKVESAVIGDTFAEAAHPVLYPVPVFPTPMLSLAAESKHKGDEERVAMALHKLAESDPCFKQHRDRQTGELVIAGTSSLHIDVSVARMKHKFNVEIATKVPAIPYKETITGKAEAQYRHKKQTGGSGQFAEVWLKVEPMTRGGGFVFSDEVKGGVIPLQFIPCIEKGVRQVLEKGAVAGYPTEDVKAIVFFGKDHPVDSKPIAFQTAGRMAFKLAVRDAHPVLLEPVMNIAINAPARCMGDIMGNLNSRRGRISDQVAEADGSQTIKAQIPQAEILNYSTELRSETGGEGSYSIEFSHYEVVPARIQEQIVARANAGKKHDEEEE
ncbi:MAG: elongation factor G [Planctomycetes bacterium]|nr:elongation factor G [Planctomycetota bacterium]